MMSDIIKKWDEDILYLINKYCKKMINKLSTIYKYLF